MTMARNLKWDAPGRTGVKRMCRIVRLRDLDPFWGTKQAGLHAGHRPGLAHART